MTRRDTALRVGLLLGVLVAAWLYAAVGAAIDHIKLGRLTDD